MKKKLICLIIPFFLVMRLAACSQTSGQPEASLPAADTQPSTVQTEASSVTESTVASSEGLPSATEPEPVPEHSALYIDGLCVEDVIVYFNEVCLDAEMINRGDASRLQKWTAPIYYKLNGNATDEDIEVLNSFAAWLNTVEGFPGIYEAQHSKNTNIWIHFCTQQDMLVLMGEDFADYDGAVTFWYTDDNVIDNAIICYRTDLSQSLRNSVILEEIYNSLGPIQDTTLRPDSIIYNEYSEQQQLTEIDELILRLLYHPQLLCGMNASECEAVIRQLYY